jgi:cell cycle sensor histidine kinase DivJ
MALRARRVHWPPQHCRSDRQDCLPPPASERLDGRLLLLAAATAIVCALVLLATLSGGIASPFLILLAALLPLEAARAQAGFRAGCRASRRSLGVPRNRDCRSRRLRLCRSTPARSADPQPWHLSSTLWRAGFLAPSLNCRLRAPSDAAVTRDPAWSGWTPDASGSGADNVLDRLPGLLTRARCAGQCCPGCGKPTRLSLPQNSVMLPERGFINRIHVADRIAFLDAVRQPASWRKPSAMSNCGSTALDETLAIRPCVDRGFGGERRVRMAALPACAGRKAAISPPGRRRLHASAVAEQAETANASKTRFLAAVSHELRTPLNAISGFPTFFRASFRQAQ